MDPFTYQWIVNIECLDLYCDKNNEQFKSLFLGECEQWCAPGL